MPWGAVTLKPGVDVEATPTANQAGFSQSSLIRFKNSFIQKIGGWAKYYSDLVGGIPRGMHAWQDLNEDKHLAIGSTTILGVITDNSLSLITPQTLITNGQPNFATLTTLTAVTVTDANVNTITAYDQVELLTPIAVGGVILSGVYPVDIGLSTTTYQISSAVAAVTSRTNKTITVATQANPCVVTAVAHGFSSGDLIYISGVVGMTQLNARLFTIANVTANTFELSGVNSTAYTAYSSGGTASPSAVPFFHTASGSFLIKVQMQDHGLAAGNSIVFPISTTLQSSVVTMTIATPGVVTWFTGTHGLTGGETIVFTTTGALPTGLTAGATYYVLAAGITTTTFRVSASSGGAAINTTGGQSGIHTATVGNVTLSGTYTVISVTDADNFIITIDTVCGANSVVPMNGGQARLKYYIAIGPAASSTGYGIGTYSSGSYSTGSSTQGQTGSTLVSTDWTHDNWGSTLLSCPEGGGIYEWTPNTGFQTSKLVSGAPLYNGGVFVAAPAQILIAWGSTETHEIGIDRDPLVYTWSDQLDYTFWTPGVINPSTGNISQAGSNRIPTGSKIVAALQGPQQALIWTDLDLWSLNYIGMPDQGLIWGQNKIGSSCGAIGSHAVGQLGNGIFWMGQNNFFALTGSGVQPVPCTVWDAVFQNLDTANAWKARACPNTPFNEMMWQYPSESGGTGENDSYVKVNITDGSWDYGPLNAMPRSAWIDQSVLGKPIGATPGGIIYQHETGNNADGQPLQWSFRTGFWSVGDAEQIAFVDLVIPDFKYGEFGGSADATVAISFHATMYPGGPERTYGPYSFTSSSTKKNVRIRGRQIAMSGTASDLNSFVRLGLLRYRWSVDGRQGGL